MSSIELTEWLARQLRDALSIIEEQARLLELKGITELEGDWVYPLPFRKAQGRLARRN